MADFKIKSAAGTGNKTLIQSQDQSDSNYAIQIGDGGASTLHNATITAGTFPAGHVLQVQHSYAVSNQLSVTQTGDFTATGNSYYTFPWGTEITTTVENSLIFLTGHISNAHAGSGSPQINVSIVRYKAGSEEALLGAVATTGASGGGIGYSSGGPTYGLTRSTILSTERTIALGFYDKPLDASGTVLKYYFVAFTNTGTANLGANSVSSLTAMEVMP